MQNTFQSKQISISINCPVETVYAFASNPFNLSKWAAGLSRSEIQKVGDVWVADSPMGRVKVRFSEPNAFGVLDHDVTLPNGITVYNPLRAIKNGNGSEVIFTLYRQPEMSEEEFQRDASMVQRDLEKLKEILESVRKPVDKP